MYLKGEKKKRKKKKRKVVESELMFGRRPLKKTKCLNVFLWSFLCSFEPFSVFSLCGLCTIWDVIKTQTIALHQKG